MLSFQASYFKIVLDFSTCKASFYHQHDDFPSAVTDEEAQVTLLSGVYMIHLPGEIYLCKQVCIELW